MKIYNLIYLVLMIGTFLLFDFSIKDIIRDFNQFTDSIYRRILYYEPKKSSLKAYIIGSKHKKKQYFVLELAKKYKKEMTQAMYFLVCLVISLAFLNKSILAIPIIYVLVEMVEIISLKRERAKHRRLLRVMETDLSLITNTYLLTNNFLDSVRTSMKNIHSPLKESFEHFLFDVDNTTPNILYALDSLAERINYFTFNEWVEKIKESQRNSDLRENLVFIIERLSKIRKADDKLDKKFMADSAGYTILYIGTLSLIGLFSFMHRGAFLALMNTAIGNIIVAAYVIIATYCFKQTFVIQNDVSYEQVMRGSV